MELLVGEKKQDLELDPKFYGSEHANSIAFDRIWAHNRAVRPG
jgi:hypothetical protein